MHNDVAARKKNSLRLERLEDLAFFKSRAHCCKKKKREMYAGQKRGRGVSEDPKVTCLIPFNMSKSDHLLPC